MARSVGATAPLRPHVYTNYLVSMTTLDNGSPPDTLTLVVIDLVIIIGVILFTLAHRWAVSRRGR